MTPLSITNPVQRRLLAALEALNALHCAARDGEYPGLAADACKAEAYLSVHQSYSEGSEDGAPEGAPLPW